MTMDSRQIGLGASFLFLSSAVTLQTGLVDSRFPVALMGMTALVATGALVVTARGPPARS